MRDLLSLTLEDVSAKLKAREISSVELSAAALSAAEAAQPKLNAFTAFDADKTLAMARASDEKLAKGEGGLIEGAPIAIKDLFAVEGVSATACSNILSGFKPTYESTVSSNIWAAGGVFLAKTSMDEFAMGSSNETAACGPVTNPWRRGEETTPLTPGGSSGGSAAALAADLCFGSTGTDTGGSIRQPAAFTGTVGVKPTYGRCSRWGVIAFASSLDHPGPFGKTVKDSAMMLQSMAGHDPRDSTSLPLETPDFVAACGASIKGKRIGVPKEYRLDGMPEEIAKVWEEGVDWLKAAGCEIVDITLPHTKYALPAYYIIAPAEASSNLARYDGMRYGKRADGADLTEIYENTRGQGFGPEVRRRIMIGTYVLSAGYYDAYYLRAQKVRTRIAEDFDQAFAQCDAILTPTAPSAAFGLGEKSDDPLEMYLNDVFTVTANLAGVPAMSLPAATDKNGLPLGLQIITRALDEETMFSVGAAVEDAAGFKARPGKWW